MNVPPRSVRDAVLQRKLDEQAKHFHGRALEARLEINNVMETLNALRRNPLTRPFVRGTLLEHLRKAKHALVQEVSSAKPVEETDPEEPRPRRFAFSAEELAAMTPEQTALVGRITAALIDQNLDVPYDPKVAIVSAGYVSRDIFTYVGVEWLDIMIHFGRLAPNHTVLDVGCGCGRLAGPLTMYLSAEGSYRGFDPVKKSVAFAHANLCQSNFRFDFVDLQHPLYNPAGVIDPESFRFPSAMPRWTWRWRVPSSPIWILKRRFTICAKRNGCCVRVEGRSIRFLH